MDLSEAIAHTVEGMGYEFVELERLPGSMLRVTIDTEQEGGISVNDCEAVSNQLTALFAAEDVDYKRLEVTSPGVERPLKKAKDWIRFAGSLAHVELFARCLPKVFLKRAPQVDGRILSSQGEPGSDKIQFEFNGREAFRHAVPGVPRSAGGPQGRTFS